MKRYKRLAALLALTAVGIGAWVISGDRAEPESGEEHLTTPTVEVPLFSDAPFAPAVPPSPSTEEKEKEEEGEGPALRGLVVDGDGAPVNGAEVAASVDGNPRPRRTESGPDGRFVLTGFGETDDILIGARAPGFAPTMMGGAKTGGDEVRIVLLPPARVHGRVRSSGGDPRPGAQVRVLLRFPGVAKPLGGMEVRADEEGQFLFTGLPSVAGTAEATWKGATSGPQEFDPRMEGGDCSLDLEVDEGPTISGRVVDTGGNPVAGLRVHARHPKGYSITARTGDDGTFLIPGLKPLPHDVSVSDVLAQYEDPAPVEGVVPPRTGLEFVVKGRPNAPGWFQFRLEDAGGRALEDVETEGVMLDGKDTSRTGWSARGDGTFRSGNRAAGRWAYTFRSPFGTARAEFTIVSGKTTDLGTIRLAPAASLRFRVVDPLGKPVDGVLALLGGTTHPERGLEREPSLFLVEGLPPGTGTVRLFHGRFDGRDLPWAAGPGEVADLGDVVLNRATGTLRGLVRSAAAGPVAHVNVRFALAGVTGSGAPEYHAVTEADGRFQIEGLAAGTWETSVLLPPRPDELDPEGNRLLYSYRRGPEMVLEPGGTAEAEIPW